MLTLLWPDPAALIKTDNSRTLVIADPHLGWELALQPKGIHVPSQTNKLTQKLITLIDKHKPDKLLIIGDVKYTVVKSEPGEWRDIPEFFTQLKEHVNEIEIIRGNHDANLEPLLPEKIKLLPATGTIIDNVGLFHGHKWPSLNLLKCKTLIMGHLHPVVILRDAARFRLTREVWVKAQIDTNQLSRTLLQKHKVKIEDTPERTLQKQYNFKPQAQTIYIMPAFNDFLGGRPINETRTRKGTEAEPLIGPLLRSETIKIDDAEIYLLDGTYLGTLAQLKTLR